MANVYAFIMAGGSGERFWPMSRSKTPKHLLRLVSERTLLEETALRFDGVVPRDRIFVLTNRVQIEQCREAVPWLDAAQFIAEPAKRDTAPAAALANAIALSRDPDALCGLFPADAVIHNVDAFQKNFMDANSAAESNDALLTFAIKPTFASTGFGYLHCGEEIGRGQRGSTIREVKRFVEKPDLETAKAYLASGQYAWNAGMFLWKARVFQQECERLQPELAAFIAGFPKEDFLPYLEERFASLPKISVDYAILEKAKRVIALEASFDWDDVGTWTALPAHLPADAYGNTVRGTVAPVASSNNIAISNGRIIALCGVDNLVVVETADAVLVCHRDAVQRIKELQSLIPDALK